MIKRRAFVAGGAAALAVTVAGPGPARAASDQQEIVELARLAAEGMLADPNFPTLRRWMARARGVLVVPSLVKAGFLIGGEGGNGVLLARRADNSWSYPAFCTVGSASIGFQVGIQDSQVMFVIMTDKGLRSMMSDEVKLGADASLAVGPVGGGVEGATTTALNADIYSYARAKGLFAGVSFEGAVIKSRESHNTAYYGRGATPRAIVIDGRFANKEADGLRRALVVRS